MYSFTFASQVSSLMDRQVTEMSLEELDLWLVVCEILERRSKPNSAERDWSAARRETQAEITRRKLQTN